MAKNALLRLPTGKLRFTHTGKQEGDRLDSHFSHREQPLEVSESLRHPQRRGSGAHLLARPAEILKTRMHSLDNAPWTWNVALCHGSPSLLQHLAALAGVQPHSVCKKTLKETPSLTGSFKLERLSLRLFL